MLVTATPDIIIQAELAALREIERLERDAEAARKAEGLRTAAEVAKRKHACLLMSKADQEASIWNEMWKAEEEAKRLKHEEVLRKEKRGRVRVTPDKHGNPIDVKL